ncbi:MAG TPA: hypothetical protein DD426_01680 [Clostridiaceae bacterium]|mgnify:CR=1 FL=1|nr:hypothetical protein [Clostridiaceae bacterium]
MNGKYPFLTKFILPVIIIVLAFLLNKTVGLILVAAYVLYGIYAFMPRYYSIRGKVRYAKDDINGAISWFKRAYKSGRAGLKTKVSYAYLSLKVGNVDIAEKILKEMVKLKLNADDEIIVKSNYALVLWKRNKLDEAISMLQDLCKKYRNSTVYSSLGYFYILNGDLDKALEFNLKAHDYNGTDNIITDNLGQTYYLMGEYEKSAEVYKKLMERSPSFPEPYYFYGSALYKMGKKDEAVEMIKKALEHKFSNLSTITKKMVEEKLKSIEDE